MFMSWSRVFKYRSGTRQKKGTIMHSFILYISLDTSRDNALFTFSPALSLFITGGTNLESQRARIGFIFDLLLMVD